MAAASSVVKEKPLSPPHSNDGDFDLGAVQQHKAELDQYSILFSDNSRFVAGTADKYGDPADYQTADTHAYYPAQSGFHAISHPVTPPTTGYDHVMRTRSGRSLGSPLTSANPETSRRSRSPKPRTKRPPRNATGNRKNVDLAEPLSVMTKDWTIPLADIEAKVERPAAQRQQEIHDKKHNGKIPRPMNSFMLYRSAYADRVKEYCKEGNHQVISQITGASWAMEPQSVKELFERYADLDRQNHQKAHPDYKFAPNKNVGPVSRKRKEGGDEDDDDGAGTSTDWGDQDYEASSTRSKRWRAGNVGESRSQTSSPFDPWQQPSYQTPPIAHQPNPSSYHVSNPRSVPPNYPVNTGEHYYQQWATSYGNNMEDVHVRRVQQPKTMHHDLLKDQSLVGLPQDPYADQMAQHQEYDMYHPEQLDVLDPRLEQYGDPSLYPPPLDTMDVPDGFEQQNFGYGTDGSFLPPQYEYAESTVHPGMMTLTSPSVSWDRHISGTEFDDDLGRWPA